MGFVWNNIESQIEGSGHYSIHQILI